MFVWSNADGDLFDDLEFVSVESDDLAGVVGHEADFPHPEVVEDLGAHAVVAQVGAEAEAFVRLDGVESLFLEFVGADLVGEADAASFLAHVDEHTAADFLDLGEGAVELAAAIAAA